MGRCTVSAKASRWNSFIVLIVQLEFFIAALNHTYTCKYKNSGTSPKYLFIIYKDRNYDLDSYKKTI